MITPESFVTFTVGILIGLFIATVFFAVRWNFEHEQRLIAEQQLADLQSTHDQMLMNTHPKEWLDASDVAVNIATKERLYDKHPDLVRPGTEVLIIESELVEDDPMERRI